MVGNLGFGPGELQQINTSSIDSQPLKRSPSWKHQEHGSLLLSIYEIVNFSFASAVISLDQRSSVQISNFNFSLNMLSSRFPLGVCMGGIMARRSQRRRPFLRRCVAFHRNKVQVSHMHESKAAACFGWECSRLISRPA